MTVRAAGTLTSDRKYLLVTRGYMGRGKDGYTSLLVESEGGEAEELVDEESGMLISTMLRQYFMGLRTVGQWKRLAERWVDVADVPLLPTGTRTRGSDDGPADSRHGVRALGLDKAPRSDEAGGPAWRGFLRRRLGLHKQPLDDDDDHFDPQHPRDGDGSSDAEDQMDVEVLLIRKFWARWARKAGVKTGVCDALREGEFSVDWTRVIASSVEGRIRMEG